MRVLRCKLCWPSFRKLLFPHSTALRAGELPQPGLCTSCFQRRIFKYICSRSISPNLTSLSSGNVGPVARYSSHVYYTQSLHLRHHNIYHIPNMMNAVLRLLLQASSPSQLKCYAHELWTWSRVPPIPFVGLSSQPTAFEGLP